jgi:hypothetical protein
MDFGLLIGVLVVTAVVFYLWLSRENDKLDGLDGTPSDCDTETKPEVNPATPPKAEPVFVEDKEEKLTPPAPPKVVYEYSMENLKRELLEVAEKVGADVKPSMTKAQIYNAIRDKLE